MAAEGHLPRLSLGKADKLLRRSDFEEVRRNGAKSVGSAMLVFTVPAESLGCGVICSRKFSTLAVRRNRARRLLWESIRLLKPVLRPCHMVLIPRRRILEYKREQVTQELQTLLEKKEMVRKDAASSPGA